MSRGVVPTDWNTLDVWWASYAKTRPVIRSSNSSEVGTKEHVIRSWNDVDSWWHTHTGESLAITGHDAARVVDQQRLSECWPALDSWWETYTETGHETAVDLAEVFEDSTEAWGRSAAQFDADPLSTALSETGSRRGPLRPSGEVRWSRWLARLLRPSVAFLTEVFNVVVESAPESVVREEQIPQPDGTFKRPDILVFCGDRAISIEVKLEDTNYGKTATTAHLVEQYYDDYEWTHILLLPKSKRGRLDDIVDPEIERHSEGQRRILWENPGPIDIVYWQDVTAAIRTVLRQGHAVDDHWAANAYLFCAVAEHELLGFQSQRAIEEWVDPANIVETVQPLGMVGTLEEQLTYLRQMNDS